MQGWGGGGGGGHHYGMGPVAGQILPGGDIGDGVKAIPEAVRTAFLASAVDGEEIIVGASSDLAPDGNFGSQHVFASKLRLCLAKPNVDQPIVTIWPLSDVKKLNVELLVGQSAFAAVIAGTRVELCRFTNSRQNEFHRLVALIEELARSGSLP